MTQFISPGVYVLEKDLSQYVSNLSSTIVAIVGTSDMGPSNVPTLVTSANQYVNIFGQPNPNHYLGYAALSYLKQGTQCYVTRVTPSDAANAKLTVPLPKAYTPYSGAWTLASNTDTTAIFNITNSVGAVGSDQLVSLPTSPNVFLPNFDFQDTTNAVKINGKLGSDLKTFASNPDLVAAYVNGRSFTVTSGYGKSSSVAITNLATTVDPTVLALTIDAKKFNDFNSPLLATATGSLVCKPASGAPITHGLTSGVGVGDGPTIAVIGSTLTAGTIKLVYNETGYTTAITKDALVTALNSTTPATSMAALETLVSVATTNVVIEVPLYHTTTTVSTAEALKNALLVEAILNALVSAYKTPSAIIVGTYPNLYAVHAISTVSYNGIIGVGSLDLVTGISTGYKAAAIDITNANAVVLSAITLGASSNYTYTAATPVMSSTNMGIFGTFSLNLHRPTWVMSEAGTAFIPTLLKFSSVGQADFSNLAITVDLTPSNLDELEQQQYVVSLFARVTGNTISDTSIAQSDFLLIEKYTGTPEVLQSSINGSSSYLKLKVDYSTGDTVDYTTGIMTPLLPSDNLKVSFGLFTNQANIGVISGAKNITTGTTLIPSFSAFLLNGSAGTTINKYDIIGDEAIKTGIYSYSDPEALDINLLIAPGWSADPDVATAMISMCSNRADAMCILDTPFGLSVQDVIAYRNNILTSGSNYAAVYYPWVQITDAVNRKNIFVPPSGMVAGQYAYNDTVGDVFTAPAGRTRGNILDATATERILNQGDRDALTLAQINPIYSEAGYGIYIRGQMTLQRATTALNRVNVRRLLLNLRKVIATASKYFEFEPGDAVTALRLKQIAESALEDRLRKGAIRSYKVDVGPNVNTAITLENNELRMSISIVPTKTAEIIIEVFNILPQGQGLTINNS